MYKVVLFHPTKNFTQIVFVRSEPTKLSHSFEFTSMICFIIMLNCQAFCLWFGCYNNSFPLSCLMCLNRRNHMYKSKIKLLFPNDIKTNMKFHKQLISQSFFLCIQKCKYFCHKFVFNIKKNNNFVFPFCLYTTIYISFHMEIIFRTTTFSIYLQNSGTKIG